MALIHGVFLIKSEKDKRTYYLTLKLLVHEGGLVP